MEYQQIGKIVNTHGIRGELKIIASTDFVQERFAVNKLIFTKENDTLIEHKIRTFRLHKHFVLLTIDNFNNINDVLYLKGQDIFSEGRATLAPNQYYYDDLINCEVFDLNDNYLGILTDFSETSVYDIWFISGPNGKFNFPNRPEFVKKVDIKNKKIIIDDWNSGSDQ